MSVPRKACNIKLVRLRLSSAESQIQSGERLAITPEQTFAPCGVTCIREAKGEGCGAVTQVKGLSPEIPVISEAKTVHYGTGRNPVAESNKRGEETGNRRGLRPWRRIKERLQELGRTYIIPGKRYATTSLKSKELQKIYRWSDKFIVAGKSVKADGAKGLTSISMDGETTARIKTGRTQELLATQPNPITFKMTFKSQNREIYLKSWMREIFMSSSVRGLIVSSRRWL